MAAPTPIAVALIAAVLASGCLGPSVDPAEVALRLPPLGLGLEIPAALPPPGPFVEGKGLEALEDFLRGEGQAILAECQSPNPQAPVILQYIAEENYAYAIEDLIWACTGESNRQLGREAMNTGTEEETYELLHGFAMEALASARAALSAHPGPGNPTEAQLLMYMMRKHVRDALFIEHAESSYWAAYQNGTFRDYVTLINAYLSLTGPTDRSWAMIEILDRYPWSAPPCEPPDFESLAERTRESLDTAFATARSYGYDVRTEQGLRNRFSDALYEIDREFKLALELGWWPLLIHYEYRAERQVAYWDSFSLEAWPTFEEARFLLAAWRNESRSISQEAGFQPHLWYFSNLERQEMHPWDTDYTQYGGAAFMRHVGHRWPYADLVCPLSDSQP
jgi:hypothetical protein